MRPMTKKEFRRALERLKMTQGAAAEFLGMSVRAVHGYANGTPIPVYIQKILRIMVNRRIRAADAEIPIRAE